MKTESILRSIIANAQDLSIIQRASRELRRENHSPETLWRIYRQAMQDPGSVYPEDILAAMQSYDQKMTAGLSENKSVVVRFRCTENERSIIQMLADREGKTLSEFIRDQCLKL